MKNHTARNREALKDALVQVMTYGALASILMTAIIIGGLRKRHSPAAKASAPATAAAPVGERVLIEVNGQKIYESEFEAAMASFPENMRSALATEAGRRQLAEQIVHMKLLEQEAERLGLNSDPKVSAPLNLMRTNLLAQVALQKLSKEGKPVDLQAYYEKNKNKFSFLKLRQILIAYQGGMVPPKGGKALPAVQAKAKAEAIVASLRKGGSFAEIARAESDDTEGGRRGGDIGSVSPRMLPPEIDKFVFALEPHQVSDPLRTDYGYHVFEVTDRGVKSFEEVRPMLEQQQPNLRAEVMLDELKARSTIRLDPKVFGTATLQ